MALVGRKRKFRRRGPMGRQAYHKKWAGGGPRHNNNQWLGKGIAYIEKGEKKSRSYFERGGNLPLREGGPVKIAQGEKDEIFPKGGKKNRFSKTRGKNRLHSAGGKARS